MKKRMLSLLCVLALCLGLLPTTALAEGGAPTALYVGNQVLKNSISYWTTDSETGDLTEYTEGGDAWNVKYDPYTVTLTLKNATVVGKAYGDNNDGIGIYATSSSGSLSLNIELDGNSKVSGMYGINVVGNGNASLNISGSGSLTVSATATNGIGIFVQAQSGDANLTIDGANVNAVVTENNGRGVELSTGQAGNPNLTIEVKGGSLQASGQPNGIIFFTNKNNTQANANLKVSGNAMVKTSGITTEADGSGSHGAVLTTEAGSGETGGIVWNGSEGTVYGNVSLNENLTIGAGETLTIGDGASLDTNGKTITVESGGKLEGTPTGSGTVKIAPTITTESLPDGEVGTAYNQPLTATGDAPITWTVSGTLPDGLSLNSDGTITGTPTAAGSSTVTVKATNSAGSAEKTFTLNIKAVSVTGVTLDPTELSLFTGGSATLTVKVEPADATNQDVTCQSNNANVATVEGGTVKAVGEGEATIIVTTVDGGYTATCKVTVTQATYSISADISPDFGSVYTGYAQPAAQTVTVTNTGNQTLNLEQPASTKSFEVGTLSRTPLAPGEKATFTVQPKAGLAAGVYREEIQVSDSGNVTLSIPVSFSVQAAAAPQVTPAPAATPAPSDNITYYTCPSCGYHNWTATEAGYRCDNCGYLESTRQLSGYGNVKGSYTPGSGATSTAASTVPQTGDESNPVLWTVLLLVSGLALGGLALRRKTEHSRS